MCNNAQGYYLHLPRPIIDRTHQPKGSMCMECVHKNDDCRELKFEDMQVIGMNNDIFIVRCSNYQKFICETAEFTIKQWEGIKT